MYMNSSERILNLWHWFFLKSELCARIKSVFASTGKPKSGRWEYKRMHQESFQG